MDLGAAAATIVASTLGTSPSRPTNLGVAVAVLGVWGPSAPKISVVVAPNAASTWQWQPKTLALARPPTLMVLLFL